MKHIIHLEYLKNLYIKIKIFAIIYIYIYISNISIRAQIRKYFLNKIIFYTRSKSLIHFLIFVLYVYELNTGYNVLYYMYIYIIFFTVASC